MNNLKQTQMGRSMVETIAVIGIMAVLAYGISYGIKHVMASTQSDEINKRIMAMATERRTHMEKIKESPYQRTQEGPYGITLTIENGTSGNHPDEFWILTSPISSDILRFKIKEYYTQNASVTQVEENNTANGKTLKIYFRKYLQ